MINIEEFQQIRKEIESFEESRESVISEARDIIHLSKQIIHACQRKKQDEAKLLIQEIKFRVSNMPKDNFDTGIGNVAIQEFVEAVSFYEFIYNNKLVTKQELNVDNANYLLGLCDLTGELVRHAVDHAVNKNFEESLRIKEFVTDLYGEFLKIKLRNGEMRKKADAIRWNLKKLEDLAFTISTQN